jgi:subtilase family serine protease
MHTHTREWIASIIVLCGAAVAASACSDGGGIAPPASSRTAPASAAAATPRGLARPAWASADRFAGHVEADERVALQVHLRMRDEAGAAAELAAISDPHSQSYRRFLSDEEYTAKYAPTAEDVAVVRAHLEASGLRVTGVSLDRAFLSVEGAASQVERAFSTRLAHYQVGASTRYAPVASPTLPDAVQSRVVAVLGLSTPLSMKPRNVVVGGVSPDAIAPDAAPRVCSAYYGATLDTTDPPYAEGYPHPLPYVPCGFTPGTVRAAYGLDDVVEDGLDGRGRKIAIVDAYMSPTLLADAQAYAAAHDPSHPLKDSQFSARWAPGTPTPVDTGWYGEQSLDVEAVHAVAPGAEIAYVGAVSANDADLIAAIDLIVTQHLATIVSNSYGETEQGPPPLPDFEAWHAVATRAGLKGVGLYFSSGDSGDESANLGAPSADFPASLDVATAVGGTSLATGQDGKMVWETAWETGVSRLKTDSTTGTSSWSPAAPGSWVYGSGGGVSVEYKQPWYQLLAVPDSLALVNGSRWRVVPDVAMVGDPITGYVIGQTSTRTGVYGEGVIGGTSLSSPLFAATMALGEQAAGHRFGFANPLLYVVSLLGGLRDVRPLDTPQAVTLRAGVVTTFDDEAGQAIHVARGYDDVTGLGSPRGRAFLGTLSLF